MTRTVKCGLMGLRITPPPERRVSRRERVGAGLMIPRTAAPTVYSY